MYHQPLFQRVFYRDHGRDEYGFLDDTHRFECLPVSRSRFGATTNRAKRDDFTEQKAHRELRFATYDRTVYTLRSCRRSLNHILRLEISIDRSSEQVVRRKRSSVYPRFYPRVRNSFAETKTNLFPDSYRDLRFFVLRSKQFARRAIRVHHQPGLTAAMCKCGVHGQFCRRGFRRFVENFWFTRARWYSMNAKCNSLGPLDFARPSFKPSYISGNSRKLRLSIARFERNKRHHLLRREIRYFGTARVSFEYASFMWTYVRSRSIYRLVLEANNVLSFLIRR